MAEKNKKTVPTIPIDDVKNIFGDIKFEISTHST